MRRQLQILSLITGTIFVLVSQSCLGEDTTTARLPESPGEILALSCSGCHQSATTGKLPGLGSQSADEIAARLLTFRNVKQPTTLMQRIAKGYSDKDIYAIATALGRSPEQ